MIWRLQPVQGLCRCKERPSSFRRLLGDGRTAPESTNQRSGTREMLRDRQKIWPSQLVRGVCRHKERPSSFRRLREVCRVSPGSPKQHSGTRELLRDRKRFGLRTRFGASAAARSVPAHCVSSSFFGINRGAISQSTKVLPAKRLGLYPPRSAHTRCPGPRLSRI